MTSKKLLTFAGFIISIPIICQAHPGSVDSRGGHYCVTNCSKYGYVEGYYHYHEKNYAGFDEDYVENGGDDFYFEQLNQPTYSSGWCRSKFGDGALGGIHECECKGGYIWNDTHTQCIDDGISTGRMSDIERLQLRMQRNRKIVPTEEEHYRVVEVVDGDTIKVEVNGEVEKVRIIGIDTPETVHSQKPLECYGKEASVYLQGVLEGQFIHFDRDPSADRDRYNRLLRYISLNGNDVGANMVHLGYAKSYKAYPHPRLAQYEALQEVAIEEERGLWKACSTKDKRVSFSDIIAFHPYVQAIRWAKETDIVRGYLDGTFRPEQPMNRAEFLKIVLESTNAETSPVTVDSHFTDVDSRDWYAPYVQHAYEKGIVQGYPNGTFRPSQSVTTAEALKIVYTTYGISTKEQSGLWYQGFMNSAKEKALFYDQQLRAHDEVKRKDVVWILYSLFKEKENIAK